MPLAKGFDSVESAIAESYWFPWPVIVKPTDAAGSKGVTRVDKPEDLKPALKNAMLYSISGRIIVEEFIGKVGCSSDSDCMSIDGKLVFTSFSAQHFDKKAANPYTPAAYSWPSTFTKKQEKYLTSEIQRLITLLKLKTAVYNIESCIGPNGKPYIMELSPRGGGNRLCEMLHHAAGVDMITAITRAMVGDPIENIESKNYNGHWAEFILHADREGVFDHIGISEEKLASIIEEDLWVSPGNHVSSFKEANNAIGTLVMKFQTTEDLEYAITNQREWLNVVMK